MSDEPGLPQPGDVVGGKYRVERAIGAGGMGAVYGATNLRTGKPVALKWLRPKLAAEPLAVKRFIREARASARIRHPNVVDVYDVEEQSSQAFLVLELLEGETLRALLRRTPRLGIGETLALLVPAMRGVAAAHAQGVVHRDIKPDNLFITRDPDQPWRRVPKVLDFGISKLAADHPLAEGTLTATGALLGTPHYMSLEQLQGSEADARCDIYAFGVVLYECLTGVRPFESDNFSAIVVKVATETPADPIALRADLPPALRDVVCRAMARRAEDRFPSLSALIDALQPFMPEEPSLPVVAPETVERAVEPLAGSQPTQTSARSRDPVRTPEPAPAPATVGAGMRGLIAALVVLGFAGGAWWLRPSASSDVHDPPAPSPAPPNAKPAATTAAQPLASAAGSAAPRAGAGADQPAAPRSPRTARFTTGWVYLGDYDRGQWVTCYFDGWNQGLPAVGTRLRARGRSYVRNAVPNAIGALAGVNTTIGPEHPVEVLELAHWQGGSFVWARVRSTW